MTLSRWQAQLDACCRKTSPTKPAKPLTGLEKQWREEQEARDLWKELRSE